MWARIKRFLRRNTINFDTNASTVPEAFDYPEEEFRILVKELASFIKNDERLQTLDNYLRGPLFEKFHLNLNRPQHAAILGYAFCAAVFTQRELYKQSQINKVFEAFYPDMVPGKLKKPVN